MKNMVIILLFTTFLLSCDTSSSSNDLVFINSYVLNIPEPSGAALDYEGNYLWIVGDENGMLYRVSFEGNIMDAFQIEANDLEGICVVNDSTIAVIDESNNEVIFVNRQGSETERISTLYPSEEPYGLEGITFNSSDNHFYFVNEMNPVSIIELNENFEIIDERNVTGVDDLSGITYVPGENVYWVVSDESKKVLKYDNNWNLIEEYKVDIDQIEGICFNPSSGILYIVSDKMETLYLFQM